MKYFASLVLLLAVSCAAIAAPPSNSVKEVDIELDLVQVLRAVLQWMKENDISIADIFSSELFNSDYFNSDIFNSQYFNSEFFNSQLFNSRIFNSENFSKVLFSLYGIAESGKGTLRPTAAKELISFFEVKDWEGLATYLQTLPSPPTSSK